MAARDQSVRRIERLLDRADAHFRREFLAMVAAIQDEHTLTTLTALLAEGRIEDALRSLDAAGEALGAAYTEVITFSGQDAAKEIQAASGEIVVRFDVTNVRAVQAMQENRLRLVREFGEQQRRATRQAILDGIERGINPREMAREFRRSIGLTQRQQGWVSNYRRLLENNDPRALARQLRDARYDPTIQRAIAEGKPLSRAQIDRMVARYRERALKYRAETIARTESLRSVHQGREAMFQQAIDNGTLSQEQLIGIWNTAADERVRKSHSPMNGQEQPFGVPFTSGAGNTALHPGAFGIAEEDVDCRCVKSTRIRTPAEMAGSATIQVLA